MKRILPNLLLLAIALTPATTWSQTTTTPTTLADIDPGAFLVQGTILSLNLSDKGVPEGIIMQSQGGIGQVNFPKNMAEALAKVVRVNDKIEVLIYPDSGPGGPGRGGPEGHAGPEAGRGGPDGGPPDGGPEGRGGPDGRGGPNQLQPDHEVFKLLALRDAKGKIYDLSAAAADTRKSVHVAGTIKAINYNNRGIPNGVQLSTGDLVRLNDRIIGTIDLTVGSPFTADGFAEAMPNGRSVIQPQSINGNTLQTPGRGGPGGPDGPDGPPPSPDHEPPAPPEPELP